MAVLPDLYRLDQAVQRGDAENDDEVAGDFGIAQAEAGMDEQARTFARNGAGVIVSPADAVYLDMKYDDGTRLGLTWANGPTSVERAYSWEPASVVEGIGDADILGVEAALIITTPLLHDQLVHLTGHMLTQVEMVLR